VSDDDATTWYGWGYVGSRTAPDPHPIPLPPPKPPKTQLGISVIHIGSGWVACQLPELSDELEQCRVWPRATPKDRR
jgi:hypothetical protein